LLKSELLKKLAVFALLFCIVVACKQSGSSGQSTTIKSADGKFQLTVPDGWKETSGLHDKARIQAANERDELYVIVLSESKSDSGPDITLDKFTDLMRKSLMEKKGATDSAQPEPVTINGNDTRQYELHGTVANVKAAFLVSTVETQDHFHQVITWAKETKYDENKATLKRVIESFRTVPASDADSNPTSSP
jgi:bifunctional DNA-binding transcriptional regulator/antitoxin component of YhaV-PrlF toxin-antitoxin module